MTRVYVPRDSAARSVGADEVATLIVAEAAARGLDVEIVRTSSRGALWLEPLVEVGPDRVGYGPVAPDDVEGLFDAGLLTGGEHDLRIGPVDTLPWLADQQRVTFVRMGITDPLSLDDYRAHGGLAGLARAAALGPAETVAEVLASGLRGRGGAGFPAGIKWRTVLEAQSEVKYICVNADEGDSGTFADRMVMEGDPFMLLEGIAIAAGAVGATEALIYVRSEYPDAIATLREAIALADGWLPCPVRVVVGAGSYVCGEETAMLESLEGKRGMVRPKPPIPALSGLFGKPTLVHNVMTLASVPRILTDGAGAYQAIGNERSRGTSVFQLAGNVAHGGIVELPFGVTLRDLVMDFGGGTRSGRPLRAVQVGGPLGAYLPHDLLDVPMEYEALAEAGGLLGHGGVVVYDDTVDMAAQARFAMEFCSLESCGKCTPCRIGSTRGVETIDKIVAGIEPAANLLLLHDLCDTMTDGSLCAMGGLTPLPVRSALKHFARDFGVSADAAASREQA
jgi:formate dehydrogenase iron-sulfur subunit